jgi:hypothetical protein
MNIPETPIASQRKDYNFTISYIEENFAIDGDLQISNLEEESRKCPFLMNRYSTMYALEERFLGNLEIEKSILYRNLWIYYTGKAPDEVYKKKPFDFKVMKSDIDFWIDADDDMVILRRKIVASKARITKLKSITNIIQYRHSQIKNSIDELKRKQGL